MKPHDHALAVTAGGLIFMYLQFFLGNGSGITFGFLFVIAGYEAFLILQAVEFIRRRSRT